MLSVRCLLFEKKIGQQDFKIRWMIQAGKSYTGEGSPSIKKLEKPVWRPKGRQLNKFRSMQFTFINYLLFR